MTIEFKTLRDDKGSEFEQLDAIYCEAIPSSERKPRDSLAAMVRFPSYRLIVGILDEKVVAFSILYLFANPLFALLEYMAVDHTIRGQGLGSATFHESTRLITAELGSVPVLLEVDSDREDAVDRDNRLRRVEFYRKLGCRRIDGLDYILPLETGEQPPLMDLMIWQEPVPSSLSAVALQSLLREVYVNVYHCHSDDKRISDMLAKQYEFPVL